MGVADRPPTYTILFMVWTKESPYNRLATLFIPACTLMLFITRKSAPYCKIIIVNLKDTYDKVLQCEIIGSCVLHVKNTSFLGLDVDKM